MKDKIMLIEKNSNGQLKTLIVPIDSVLNGCREKSLVCAITLKMVLSFEYEPKLDSQSTEVTRYIHFCSEGFSKASRR